MPSSLVIPKEPGWTAASTWRLALRKILPPLILFFSATQLGAHFWPESSLVYGIRVDYLSPTLYFLDLLILLYLLVSKFENLRINDLRIIAPLLLTNLLYSHNPLSTLAWSLHLLLYLIFMSTIKFENWRIWDLRIILTLAILFQVALALVQVLLGHSLQGPLYYLGERMVAVGAPSIATGTFYGQTILRAYGTFSHPNVLAGWLGLAFLIIHKLNHRKQLINGYWLLVVTTLGIVLTQSRSAALAFFGFVIPFSLFHSLRSRIIYFTIIALFVIRYSLFTLPRADLSLSERLSLQQVSLQVIEHFPLFGTGANASISTYPVVAPNFRLLQPDHNSLTLLLSWFGLFGVLALLATLRSQFENWRIYDLRIILPLIPLLLLDHYLLTSPQGLFICLLCLSVVNSSHAQSYRE